MADFTLLCVSSTVSKYVASSFNVIANLPLTSPARTNEIKRFENILGCLSNASDKRRPLRILFSIFKRIFL